MKHIKKGELQFVYKGYKNTRHEIIQQVFLVLIDGQFRYAQLKEIELDECREKYDHFLRRSRKKAFLTTNQLCAGDDKVRKYLQIE